MESNIDIICAASVIIVMLLISVLVCLINITSFLFERFKCK